jgi:hypothetical protein
MSIPGSTLTGLLLWNLLIQCRSCLSQVPWPNTFRGKHQDQADPGAAYAAEVKKKIQAVHKIGRQVRLLVLVALYCGRFQIVAALPGFQANKMSWCMLESLHLTKYKIKMIFNSLE